VTLSGLMRLRSGQAGRFATWKASRTVKRNARHERLDAADGYGGCASSWRPGRLGTQTQTVDRLVCDQAMGRNHGRFGVASTYGSTGARLEPL
jgi:hypothetical protein